MSTEPGVLADASKRSAVSLGPAPGRGPMSPLWPVLSGVLAAASFGSMDACIKFMAPRYDAVQLAFFRFAAGSVFAVALWLWQRPALPRGAGWRMHGLRSILLLVCLVSYFHALTLLPLAQAVVIAYMAPIFTSLLAMLVLRERPGPAIGLSLGLGLAGIAVSLWPELAARDRADSAARLEGIAAAALSALTFAGVLVLARLQAQRDALFTIVLVQNLLPLALLTVPAALTWQPLDLADLLPIFAAGALATVGLLCLTWTFTYMEASRAAPLEYTGFLWAALLGWWLFGEVPSSTTAVTALLIVGGCLLLLRR